MPTVVHPRTSIVPNPQDAPLRKRAAFVVGGLLAQFLRTRSQSVESGIRRGSAQLLDRLIRHGIIAQALNSGDHARLRDLHRDYWRKEGLQFGKDYAFRFEEQFLQCDAELIHIAINDLNSDVLENVVEIGCGNGKVLEYVSQKLAYCKELVGIDIDRMRISANRQHYREQRLNFVACNALDWFRENAKCSTLIMTNGGVLEYFLEAEISEIFAIAAQHNNTAVALIETVGSNHDLENDRKTHPYGRELAFSHNYIHLLEKAGFEIQHFSERPGKNGDRWVRIFATHAT